MFSVSEQEEKTIIKKTLISDDAYQPEQVDIQQQMKELLKKQKTARTVQPEEDIEEEIEEDETKENV